MGRSNKKKKQEFKPKERKPPNQAILDSIGSPNVWTPETEDIWHKELKGIPAGEIYRRFPPTKKPMNVSYRGKNSGE